MFIKKEIALLKEKNAALEKELEAAYETIARIKKQN